MVVQEGNSLSHRQLDQHPLGFNGFVLFNPAWSVCWWYTGQSPPVIIPPTVTVATSQKIGPTGRVGSPTCHMDMSHFKEWISVSRITERACIQYVDVWCNYVDIDVGCIREYRSTQWLAAACCNIPLFSTVGHGYRHEIYEAFLSLPFPTYTYMIHVSLRHGMSHSYSFGQFADPWLATWVTIPDVLCSV